MQCKIIVERIDSADPAVLDRALGDRLGKTDVLHRSKLERTLLGKKAAHLHWHRFEHLRRNIEQVPKPIRAGHVRHLCLVFETVLGFLKGCRKIEYRSAVLDRDDASHRERTTVPCPIDLIDDRLGHVATTQEVSMQGVREAVVHRVLSC